MSGSGTGSRGLALLLVAVNLVLVGVLAWELRWSERHEPDVETGNPAPRLAGTERELPRFTLPPLGQYAEIVERPLFSEDRRPSEIAPHEAGPAPDVNFRLIGVVLTKEKQEALFQLTRRNEIARGGLESWIEGWMIESIEPDRVMLRRGPNATEMVLERSSPPAANRSPEPRTPRQEPRTPRQEAPGD